MGSTLVDAASVDCTRHPALHPPLRVWYDCLRTSAEPPPPPPAPPPLRLSISGNYELIPPSSPVSPPPFRLSTSGQLADSSDMVLLALDARQRAAELSRGAAGCRSVLQLCVGGGVGGAGATLYQYITMRHLFPRQTQRTIN